MNQLQEITLHFSNSITFGSLPKKFRLLGENPSIGAVKHDLILNLRQFPFKNYNIFYFPIENGVEIYRVLHSSRDNIQIFDDVIDDTK